MAACYRLYVGIMFVYAFIYGSRSDSLYSIMHNMSLVEFTLKGEPTRRVVDPNAKLGVRTDAGLTCYDATHYRYYYLYQNITNIPASIGIASYDLFNNVSLNSIGLNDHFKIYAGLENAFLVSCNPTNGDLYVIGTSILDSKIIHLYRISFIDPPDSLPYNKQLTYNITEIASYFDFNQLLNDNYINQPHIFDAVTNTIWFAHYYGDYISSNNWIWYQINVINGKIMQENEVVHFPNFTYLNYDMNRNKIIGAKLDIVDNNGGMTVTLYNTNDFSIYYSYGMINNFYPCNSIPGVSGIDFENNIWYIVNKFFNFENFLCDKTVISYFDINPNNKNITYLNSSSSRIQGGIYSVTKIEYYPVINVSATINNEIINTTNDKFVSYTIDMGQLVGHAVNLTDPQLIYLASQLSPNILRVGGTDSDYTYYEVGDENPCHLPVVNGTPGYYCYSMQEFEQVIQFARKTGSLLVFGLSIGYPQMPTNDSCYWNSTNTRQFLRHLHDIRRYTNEDIYGFELGNEVSNNPYTDAEPQADAFLELHSILSEIWYQEMKNDSFYFKLFGFDNSGKTLYIGGNFSYYPTFVNITCPILTGLTYHVYIGGTATKELKPEWLDRQYEISNKVSNIFNNNDSHYNLCADNMDDYNRIKNNVIAGEIAYHSGENVQTNLLNTYIDGFWYMDVFGLLGNLGHAYIFRQTLADNGYGLIKRNNYYFVHPDYFTALLAKNLLSNNVIGTYSNQQHLRIYARCLNTKYAMKNINNILPQRIKNGIVIQYINLFFRHVNIELDRNIVTNLENTTQIYLWSLTANNETNLQSVYMNLNGVKLELNSSHQVPNLNGKLVTDMNVNQNNKMNISVPQTSYGFVVFTQTNIDACQ